MMAGKGEARVVTFGCRTNTYESEVIRRQAEAAGLHGAIVVNTCAVTGEAERQARQTIRKLKRENPEAEIIVTGCAAQVNPEAFAAMPEVSRVLGNAEKLEARNYAAMPETPILVSDIAEVHETAAHSLSGFEGRARAFVQVQQGCDHRCTFCIVPTARGPNRSVPLGGIVEQAKTLVAGGYKEIILTGVDILSYGTDLPGKPPLAQAIRRLLKQVPKLERLRLTTLDPAVVDEDLLALIAGEPKIMPHIHLSVQAGDDLILKRMKRRHSRAQVGNLCGKLKDIRPGIALGADLITGFPTEDETMAENSFRLVEECGFSHLHVFPYSPREGTPAARMKQVPGDLAKARAVRLREAGETVRARFLASKVGTTAAVLVEKPGFGHSEHYLPVSLDQGAEVGTIQAVTIKAVEEGVLRGE